MLLKGMKMMKLPDDMEQAIDLIKRQEKTIDEILAINHDLRKQYNSLRGTLEKLQGEFAGLQMLQLHIARTMNKQVNK